MKARKFTNEMRPYHHNWAAEVLYMDVNLEIGPDLIDDDKFVELKFALKGPFKPTKDGKSQNYPLTWTVLENQMTYPESTKKKGFWSLALYKLSKPVKSINAIDIIKGLESLVINRELYIVEFDWMKQYPPHNTSGKTEISEWNNTLRYPKFKDIPQVTDKEEVEKGNIYLTEGVSRNDFSFVPF
jgi:hypothetical protein